MPRVLIRQGSSFHFRRTVPARLRPVIGRREFWASLGTSSPTLARARAGRLYAQAEEIFGLANDIVRNLEAALEEQEAAQEIEQQTARLRAEMLELKLLSAQAKHDVELGEKLKAANAKLAGLVPAIHRVGGQLTEARRNGKETRELAADLVELVKSIPRVSMPAASTPPSPAVAEPDKPLLSTLVEPFFKRRLEVDGTLHQVVGQERGTVRRFMEAVGDQAVNKYGRADITRFLNLLRQLPAKYGRSPKDKDLSLDQLIARAEKSGEERLTDKTVKRHLSTLSQFFQFAVDQGHLTVTAHTDMLSDHRFKSSDRGAREQRDLWEPAELKTLFSSPVWTGSQRLHPSDRAGDRKQVVGRDVGQVRGQDASDHRRRGQLQLKHAIQTTSTPQRGVDATGMVGGCNNNDTITSGHAIEFSEKGVCDDREITVVVGRLPACRQ